MLQGMQNPSNSKCTPNTHPRRAAAPRSRQPERRLTSGLQAGVRFEPLDPGNRMTEEERGRLPGSLAAPSTEGAPSSSGSRACQDPTNQRSWHGFNKPAHHP